MGVDSLRLCRPPAANFHQKQANEAKQGQEAQPIGLGWRNLLADGGHSGGDVLNSCACAKQFAQSEENDQPDELFSHMYMR